MMLLKNEMEDKQLNLNQPILSARRFSSTTTSKKDQKRKTDKSILHIPSIPTYKSELRSGPISNPGTVPFIWEQSPGRPKCENTPENFAIEQPKTAPKLPPWRISKAKKQDSDKVDEKLTRFGSLEDTIEEDYDSVDGNEAYSDAVDSLSETESFSLNCSITGVSGMDGRDLKRSGIALTDPLTRDLMMGWFLPAAKAVASETPQYAPWKQPREVKKTANDNRQSPLRDRPHIVPCCIREIEKQESDDEYEECEKSPFKVCGMLPRFCFLNLVPGMSMGTRVPMSPIHGTQSPVYDGRSLGGLKTTESRFHKQKESLGIHRVGENSSGSPIVEKTLYVDTIHKVESPEVVNSYSPDTQGKPSLRKKKVKILTRSKQIAETHLVDSCVDTDSSNVDEEEVPKGQPNDQKAVRLLKRNQEVGVDEEFSQDFTFPGNREDPCGNHLQIPVPPPLPKSPTDSWLSRTLPSTSTKNLFVWSKTSSGDPELTMNAKTTQV